MVCVRIAYVMQMLSLHGNNFCVLTCASKRPAASDVLVFSTGYVDGAVWWQNIEGKRFGVRFLSCLGVCVLDPLKTYYVYCDLCVRAKDWRSRACGAKAT